jgi:PPK2 family polyphosphate:nucleotide phosphotransferase
MNLKHIVRVGRNFARPYRVGDGRKFRLKDFDSAGTGGLDAGDKPQVREALEAGIRAMEEFQERLYAQNQHALLLVFQAMDAAGKDSAIKHVMSGVNPQGCEVYSFKAPSTEELDHDYLWRCQRALPERGRIGIFNRSYYEEVLVVRVHPELLGQEHLPPALVTKGIWKQRFREIRHFERHLHDNGIVVLKFFLHVSRSEQKKRFLERLDRPEKNWKFSPDDLRERAHWRDYQRAYEDAIRHTATADSPWYVVPADNKWFTRIVVAAAIVEALDAMQLKYPRVGRARRKELREARRRLKRGK